MHVEIVASLKAALAAKDVAILEQVFADDVRFGTCLGRPQVVQFLRNAVDLTHAGTLDVEAHPDRILVTLARNPTGSGEPSPAERPPVVVLFVQHGRVVELQIVSDRDEALAAAVTPPPPSWSGKRTGISRLAAVLPVRDLSRALEHYRLLGFAVSAYGGGGYGYAERGGVSVHFAVDPGLDPARTTSAVYLYVDDADALFAEWRAAGPSGQFFEPQDTEYGLREGAHVDLDGNLLRFGSSLADKA